MPVTACPLDCPDTCSLEVTVADGRVTRFDAAPGNPLTRGFICQKVKHHAELVHGRDRVLTPLLRAGPKGRGELRAASWDEALDVVVDGLRTAEARGGASSVIPYLYGSSSGLLAASGLGPRLWRRFGASEVAHTICAATAGKAWRDTFGVMPSADPLDVVHARLLVFWGANPTVSNTHLPPLVREAQDAGARLVVVDPRRTAIAARADVHVAVRPGTDVVLALAMARHLFAEGLVDHDFLARHVDGVDAYREAAEPWALEKAASVCGVAAADIAALAEAYATTRPALLRPGWGLERNRNGGSAWRAVLALAVLCGQFGRPGSGVLGSTSSGAPVSVRAGDPDARLAWPDRRVVNMNHLGALLCGELEGPAALALFVQGANPAVTCPDQGRVLRGLARDDLFTVVHEQVLTDTARYADVVLPATTHVEADDLATSYGSFTLQRMPRLIEPVGESRTNDEVTAAIAARLGYPSDVFRVDPPAQMAQAVLDGGGIDGTRVVRPAGTTVQLRDVWPSFADRRIRLHDPDGELPVPTFEPLATAFPLALLTPASTRTINSVFGGTRGAEPVLSLAPPDATARGIADADPVRVWNDQGEMHVTCRVDASLRAGVCSFPKGVWLRAVKGGRTANTLVPATISDLAGGACFNDARVEVARATATTASGADS
jgi:anaerobic selenocysteine-containing dehydrogenase